MEPARTTADMGAEPVPPLTLAAGDVIDVKFFYVPELDESQIVRPDGFMTLQLIGDVQAHGKTPAELHRELAKRYSIHLKSPNITIMVRRVNDSRVWVGGEVKRPGPVQMAGRLTVLEAIMDVGGGARPMADLKNVLVVRQRGGKSYGCLVNIKEVLRGKESEVFFLQPRDVVYVPPTAITKVDDWVDQYINKVVPQARTLFIYPMGPGGAGQVGIDTTTTGR
ncbi:MAG: polysaccharide biosynthesis/export family protein [Deltaproteobacteria bacterium]|nr:polysaccharide biosynthesis/export family protein [Deltaproteobacteria bacterium]MBI4796852.1 polysaccharide biosynthesis/export family protein [Deltaproteobacteria bacterium]